jgi:hypothetical protein
MTDLQTHASISNVRWYCIMPSGGTITETIYKNTYMFNEFAHSGLGDTTPTKNLHSITGCILCAASCEELAESNGPGKELIAPIHTNKK